MMEENRFDLIVIGAGPGGYETAARAAARGDKVLVAERDLPGGTCLNRGCIPTKCLCASASAILGIMEAAEFGISVGGEVKADYGRAVARMNEVVAGLRQGVGQALGKCTVIYGEALLTKDGKVNIGGTEYSADRIIIATGSRPATLPVTGADLCMTSDDFLRLESLPESVTVIGGGVIGLEFASVMAAFGTAVTVVEYCPEILPPFDAEVAKRLRSYLSRRGIRFITGAAVTSVSRDAGTGKLVTAYTSKKGEASVESHAVLMAVGRAPVVPEGASEAGIVTDRRGFIVTDPDTFETSVPGIYAIGDCNGRMMLAHVASAQGLRVLGEDVRLDVIPSAVFTVPEAAMTGFTEAAAKAAVADPAEVGTAKAMYAGNGKARAMGETDGFVKVVYGKSDGRILGAHIIGAHASDLIAEFVTAIDCGLTVNDVAHRLVHGHPTLSEITAGACSAAVR